MPREPACDRFRLERVQHQHALARGHNAAVEQATCVVGHVDVVAGHDLAQASLDDQPLGDRPLAGSSMYGNRTRHDDRTLDRMSVSHISIRTRAEYSRVHDVHDRIERDEIGFGPR